MKLKFIAYDQPISYDLRPKQLEINLIKFSHNGALPGILEDFEDFLRGAGFRFDGSLEIVADESENE